MCLKLLYNFEYLTLNKTDIADVRTRAVGVTLSPLSVQF